MKKILLFSLVSILTISAQAEVVFVKNKFWQTPLENQYKLSLQVKNSDLANDLQNECQKMQMQVSKNTLDKSELEMFDTLPLDSDQNHLEFYYEMRINLGIDRLIELNQNVSEVEGLLEKSKKNDLLPQYTQQSQALKLDFDNAFTQVELLNLQQSLYNQVLKFNLRQNENQKIESRMNGYYIVLKSKALACDLLTQSVRLVLKKPVLVIIDSNESLKLQTLYKSFQDKITESFAKANLTEIAKASLIGFKLKDFFQDDKTLSSAKEERFVYLVNYLLNVNKLNYSTLWDFNSFGYYLNVTNSIYTDQVKINLIL